MSPTLAPVDFRILVKDVKEKVLPTADDEWAAEASEFDTVDELRADIARRLSTVKKVQAQMALQEKAAEALAALVTDDIPDALVNAEMQTRLQDLALRLQAQGIELDQYLAATGKDQEAFVAELRETSTRGVRVDLALRAVAEAEGIEADDDDLGAEYAAMAERMGEDPEQVRRQFERNEQVPLVRSDVKKRKALEWLLEQVEVVDEQGTPIDRSALEVNDDPPADATDPPGAEQ
jgi:trigger factor